MKTRTIEEIYQMVRARGHGIEEDAAVGAAHQGQLYDVDTQNDGHDSLVVAGDEDGALEQVALNRPNDSAAHPEGRAAWARERRWTAERIRLAEAPGMKTGAP